MTRENRGGRPGGNRPQGGRSQGPGRSQRDHRTERGGRGARPGGERPSGGPGGRGAWSAGERSAGSPGGRGTRSAGERPSGDPGGFRERPSGGQERFARKSSFGERAGDRAGDRGGQRWEGDRKQGERRSPGQSRFGDSRPAGRGRHHDSQPGSRVPGNNPKKLILQREKRPSRNQLLKELGYADHKAYRESTRKSDSRIPEIRSELIRLNRFIANSGICSRREADKYIAAGVVTVNGQIITELGSKVSPGDEVRFDGRLITPERKVYLLLNKPKDFVTTTDDPNATQTVMDLIKNACEERVYPVGRLDRNTTGLLLFTNDGDLAKRLSHPSHKVEKVYQVTLDKVVSVNDIQKLADGFELEDGFISADAITYVESMEKNVVGVEIHSGRNRIVRRMFEHLGYRVRGLDRVSYAGLTKKSLPRGKWRFLSPPEVSFLKMK